MESLLWTVPVLPLAGFFVLFLAGSRLPRSVVSMVGVGSVAAAAVVALLLARDFLIAPPAGGALEQPLWTIFDVGGLRVDAALRLDALSLLMTLVVTVVGALIHVYSTAYMHDDPSYARFFACMNLFVAAMLTLVLADDLFFLFLGWEGVGVCSFLLIGFWFDDPANGRAAAKAFLVTRIGDVFLAVAMFLLASEFGTLHIATILERAPQLWGAGAGIATVAALLVLGGAIGKSGQLPLQVWLPDAMAGPTPVSALIHAATMVTAGVYLIARMNGLFLLAPGVMTVVAIIGALTLLVAGAAALAQRDIKRVLAYSTISQIGYMFLALGVGAWSAALFHFFTHAIFKALLFMAAGAIIVALHHEQDMFRMGGLRQRLPVVFWTFVIGAVSLAALPLIGAGFFSKDMILFEVATSGQGGWLLWAAGFIGAFVTALYTCRMVCLTFFGESRAHHVEPRTPMAMTVPLVVLAVAASVAGGLEIPRTLGHYPAFSHFLEAVLPHAPLREASVQFELMLQAASVLMVAAGLFVGWRLWQAGTFTRAVESPTSVQSWLASGLGFDRVYGAFVTRPYKAFAVENAADPIDSVWRGVAVSSGGLGMWLRVTQNGRLRWYAAALGAGLVVAVFLVVYT
jgi:NADH-quinone oxidoreductase subunit L